MEKQLEIVDFLKSNQLTAVQALEGFKKTRTILQIILDFINEKNNEVAIIACKSYELLKEKQQEILRMLNETDTKFAPIVAAHGNKEYEAYYYDKENTSFIPKEAKVILITQKALQKGHHRYTFQYEVRKYIKWIFVDEFDATIGIVPSLHYLWNTYTLSNYYDSPNKLNKSEFLKFLKNEYSEADYYRIENSKKDGFTEFFKADWIEKAEEFGIKVTFATSEHLAISLLGEVGFNTLELKDDEDNKFKNHIVHLKTSPCVNSFLFNRLNTKNEWSIFGFNTIISDKYNPLTGETVDIKVLNHTLIRGTNSLAGKDIMTIIGYVPNIAIQKVVDTLNYFNKSIPQTYTYEIVEQLFYRDRLMQAIGRVIGYRGLWKDKTETWVLAHEDIITPILTLKEDLQIPYQFKEWELGEKFSDIEISILEDKRIKKEESSELKLKYKQNVNKEVSDKITKYFKPNIGSRMTYQEIKDICEKNSICSISGKVIQQKLVANQWNLDIIKSSTRTNGKITPTSIVIGLDKI